MNHTFYTLNEEIIIICFQCPAVLVAALEFQQLTSQQAPRPAAASGNVWLNRELSTAISVGNC